MSAAHDLATSPERRLLGAIGALGVLLLVTSFVINPGPPSGATPAALHAFAEAHARDVRLAGWLQAVGPAMLGAFVLGVVSWLDDEDAWLARLSQFGMNVIMLVSLIEVTLYFGALYSSPEATSEICLNLIHSVQHLYFIVAAPMVFLPFGAVLLKLGLDWLGWSAIALGGTFGVIGLLTVFDQALSSSVTTLGGLQALWWLAAALWVASGRFGRLDSGDRAKKTDHSVL